MPIFRKEGGALQFVAEAFALLLSFLMPLKLGTLSGVPEMPMAYWSDPVAIIISAWPPTLIAPLGAALLALCICLSPWTELKGVWLRIFALLWMALAAVSLLGFVNCSTWDFALHAVAHCFGIACYAAALCLLLERRPDFMKALFGALLIGMAFSLLSGLYQYFEGFEATRKFAYEQELKSGVEFLRGQFKTRLEETRVSADFTLCNVFAGYLILVGPLLLSWLWTFAGKIEPAKISRPLLGLPVLGVLLFLLAKTGSRTALLSLIVAAFVLSIALPLAKRYRYAALGAIPFLLAGFAILVKSGRGFGSMTFRFDYYLAALKMMISEPLSGVGWGGFFHDYMRLKLLVNDEAPHTPHNFALLMGSQCGVLGLLLALALLALPITLGCAASWRRAKANGGIRVGLDEILLFGYCAWALHTLNEVDFETPGLTCVAIAIGSSIICRAGIWGVDAKSAAWKMEKPLRVAFTLLSAGILVGALLFGRTLLESDIAYANLQSHTDFRFMTRDEIEKLDPGKASEAFRRCLELSPKSPFPYAAMADYYIGLRRLDDAVPLLREAIARSPKRASFHFKLFTILRLNPSTWDEAAEELRKARTLFPGNPAYAKAQEEFEAARANTADGTGTKRIPSVFDKAKTGGN